MTPPDLKRAPIPVSPPVASYLLLQRCHLANHTTLKPHRRYTEAGVKCAGGHAALGPVVAIHVEQRVLAFPRLRWKAQWPDAMLPMLPTLDF